MVICCAPFTALTAGAETSTAEIITLEEAGDFTVLFTYDKEQPSITFISPSEQRYTEGSDGVEAEHGDLWSSYKLTGAEEGTWSVEYDKKSNTELHYSVLDTTEGLWIQHFELKSVSGSTAKVAFRADKGDEDVSYSYSIGAVAGSSTDNVKELKTGNAKSGEEVSLDVDISGLSTYENYKLKLEISYSDGIEMFDSALTDSFSYTNPDAGQAISDFKMYVDLTSGSCTLNWDEYAEYSYDSYLVMAYADGDTEEPCYSGEISGSTQAEFAFPYETKKLSVSLYYRDNGVLSQPLTKEVDFESGESLLLDSDEVTSSAQVTLEYKVNSERVLKVTLGENESEFRLTDEGSLGISLEEGSNTFYAEFESDENIFYTASKEIFYDSYPPEIVLYENPDGRTFDCDSVLIQGRIKNGSKLLINGEEATLADDGEFSWEAKLTQGDNTVKLEAYDEAGNGAVQNLNLIRKQAGLIATVTEKGSYIPLIASLSVSIIIIILALIFMKKKSADTTGKSYAGISWVLLWVLDVVLVASEAVSVWSYIGMRRTVNSIEFIELAEKSVSEASEYLKHERFIGLYSIVIGVALIVSVLITIIALLIKRRKKARK